MHYTSFDQRKRANAAVLIGAYAVSIPLSFCLPLSLPLIAFSSLKDSHPGQNLSCPCKLATQLFPSKPTVLPHRQRIHLSYKVFSDVCQTPPQRHGQSADWLVRPPRRGGTITTSLTGSRASLSCSTAFIHLVCHVHSGPCETRWPYEPCQLIAPLDISTLPVPGALKEGLRSGQIYCSDGTVGFVKGTGASCNVGQWTSDKPFFYRVMAPIFFVIFVTC